VGAIRSDADPAHNLVDYVLSLLPEASQGIPGAYGGCHPIVGKVSDVNLPRSGAVSVQSFALEPFFPCFSWWRIDEWAGQYRMRQR
jgi:hypothetical protein